MLRIYVIGCGGIGGYVLQLLPGVLSSLSMDVLQQRSGEPAVRKLLERSGNIEFPCVADSLTLVDGDTFDARNAIRQGNGAGSKIIMRLKQMRSEMINFSFLRRMRLTGVNSYVNPGNIASIIPAHVEPSEDNEKSRTELAGWDKVDIDLPVVFLGVDNLKTRYEVSKYMETMDDCIMFNGGNNKTAGHVTVYERHSGVALDPPLYEIFENVKPDADKRPDELSCETVAPQHDQIAVTNALVANIMLARFIKWARDGLTTVKEGKSGPRKVRYNEIMVDIDQPSLVTFSHLPTKKE